VTQAAEILGLSTEAVRSRIRRGTLPIEWEGSTVYVLIDQSATNRPNADQSRQTADQFSDEPANQIEMYKEWVGDLRDQLRAERQGHAEARRLLAAALERTRPSWRPRQRRENRPQRPRWSQVSQRDRRS
jgi:hypothetical protein